MISKLEIYLLRHGASTANEKMLVCGASDYPLSYKGIAQARQVSEHLSTIPFNFIYASPLSRVQKTICELKEEIQIETFDELKELNTGTVSHITLPELWKRDHRYRQPWLYPSMRYPDGETFEEMTLRIINWYKGQKSRWTAGNKVLIAGHEGTLRSIYMHLFQLELKNYPNFPIGNCDYLKFEIENDVVSTYTHRRLENTQGM